MSNTTLKVLLGVCGLVLRFPSAGLLLSVMAVPLQGETQFESQVQQVGDPVSRLLRVNAGPNQTITLPSSANLSGTATGSGTLTTTWSEVSGPGTVIFGNVNATSTTASFSTFGTYDLRLTASGGGLSSTSDVIITVNPPTSSGPSMWITGHFADSVGMPVSAIPWSKFTHVNMFAMSVNASANLVNQWVTPGDIAPFVSGGHAAGKKVLIVFQDNFIGGGAGAWTSATSNANIDLLAANMTSFVNTNGFDGIDLDWERSVNTTQYVNLLTKLRAAMPGKLIAIDVGEWLATVVTQSYMKLDQINVMCYDMTDGNSPTWHNDALFAAGGSNLACDHRLGAFSGVPKSKIGVGIPFYGYRWTGVSGLLQTGGTQVGQIHYNIIVTDPTRWQTAFQQWDATHQASYLSIPSLNEFISYNGTQSIQAIVPWAKAQGYGGIMTFAINDEYISSQTGDDRYPLSTVLSNAVAAAP